MNKPSLIILEGTDKSGKSTTAILLSKKIKNSVLIHGNIRPYDNSEKERKKVKDYYRNILKILRIFKDKTIILDRYYPSQMIYSIKREKDEFKDIWYKNLEKDILKINHLFIYVRPLEESIIKRLKKEGDEYVDEQDIKILIKRYDNFYKNTKLNKIKITSSDDEKLKKIWST